MSIRPVPGRRHPGYPRTAEQIQREHELNGALEAARTLQARLEMLGDRHASVRWLRTLRNDLATELGRLEPNATAAMFGNPEETTSPGDRATALPGVLDRAEQDALTRQALIAEDEVSDGR